MQQSENFFITINLTCVTHVFMKLNLSSNNYPNPMPPHTWILTITFLMTCILNLNRSKMCRYEHVQHHHPRPVRAAGGRGRAGDLRGGGGGDPHGLQVRV